MTTTTTITLAVPTPFAVEPARLVAWLAGRGYSTDESKGAGLWSLYTRGEHSVPVPLRPEYSDYPRCIRDAVVAAARCEEMAPAALAALLAPPVEGPALQWAHMAAPAQARILALLDGPAKEHRDNAAWARAKGIGFAETAMREDGLAMEYEAAAAVLRGGGER